MIGPHSKLHKLIEFCSERFDGVTDFFDVIINNAEIFYCGEVSGLPAAPEFIDTSARPPFGDTILEFSGNGEHLILFIGDTERCSWKNKILNLPPTSCFFAIVAKQSKDKSWHLSTHPIIAAVEKNQFVSYINIKVLNDGISELEQRVYLRLAAHVFQLLRCVDIVTKDNHPPLSLNKKRIKNGKKPLYSFKTLSVLVPNYRHGRNDNGGTHASPRLHRRRGHYREYANGLKIWIESHYVGKNHGFVDKNYRLRSVIQSLSSETDQSDRAP